MFMRNQNIRMELSPWTNVNEMPEQKYGILSLWDNVKETPESKYENISPQR